MTLIRLCVGLGLIVSVVGCKSLDKPASASFASVVIDGRRLEEIRDATVAVFQQDGYKVAIDHPDHMVFEKEGSRMNQISYGQWLSEGGVWVRVKAQIVVTTGHE